MEGLEQVKAALAKSITDTVTNTEKVKKDAEKSKNDSDKAKDSKYAEDADGNPAYILGDKVLVNTEGVFVNGKYDWYTVAEFPFQIKHLIRTSDDEVFRILQVGNDKELNLDTPIFIKLTNKDFSSAAKFRTALYKQQRVFLGKDDDLFKVLNAMPKVNESIAAERLGWNKDAQAYFFSNVAVKDGNVLEPDEFGMVKTTVNKDGKDVEKTFFMPYVDSITGGAKKDDTVDSFTYFPNKDITFNKWFQMLYDAHKHYCIFPACFAIASIFRDILFAELRFMPFLYVKGVRGSGKSSIIRNLTAIFGKPQREVSLKGNQNTPKSMARMMNQKSNALVWLDEYHNDIIGNVQGMLQSMYDGAGYQKASFSNDNKVDNVDVQSAIVLTSNYLPENEIFFSRTILVQANETQKTSQQRDAFKSLIELERGGLSQVCVELLQYRSLIEQRFKEMYNSLYSYFFDNLPGVDTRFLDNMAGMLAPAMILLQEKKIRMVNLDFFEELGRMAVENIRQQFEILQETSVTLEFWNIIQVLFDRGLIRKGQDLKLLNETVGDKVLYNQYLAIRLGRLYVPYAKEAGNRAKSQQEISEELVHSEFFVCKKDVRFLQDGDALDGKQNLTNPTSSIILDYQKLSKKVGVKFN